MSIKITITEEEILKTPNDCELGENIRSLYFDQKNQSSYLKDDEHFILDISPDGMVKKIIRPWVCGICGEDTSKVNSEYLIGYDHLECSLENDPFNYEKDKCVICGKKSPYLRSTNIYERIGYVEGAGQGCFHPNKCL